MLRRLLQIRAAKSKAEPAVLDGVPGAAAVAECEDAAPAPARARSPSLLLSPIQAARDSRRAPFELMSLSPVASSSGSRAEGRAVSPLPFSGVEPEESKGARVPRHVVCDWMSKSESLFPSKPASPASSAGSGAAGAAAQRTFGGAPVLKPTRAELDKREEVRYRADARAHCARRSCWRRCTCS